MTFFQKVGSFIKKIFSGSGPAAADKKNGNGRRDETILVRAGYDPDPATGSCAVPIYQSSSYVFRNTDHAASLFSLDEEGHIYSRMSNPTDEVLEKRITALEGGVGALALASGMSAITVAILTIARAGDEIVSASNLYGGTRTFFQHTLSRLGITVKFVDAQDLKNVRAAIGEKTKAVYAESIGNPKLSVLDFEAVAQVAHEHHLPLIVDNTVAPYLIHPFAHGVDIIVYSATKYIGGHGTSIGGLIVDSGKFDWNSGKFPSLSEPDEGYHGLQFTKKFGAAAFIARARASVLRDIGPAMSPFNAFLFLQGLETLHLRMERHVQNALTIARFLENHPKVAWVNYPGLESSPEKKRADRYLPLGAGALIGFGVKGGLPAGKQFIDSLKMISHLANIGDAKTLAIHPASTTHQQLSASEQQSAGVTEDFIRLSVGIEHVDDIIADIDQALKNL